MSRTLRAIDIFLFFADKLLNSTLTWFSYYSNDTIFLKLEAALQRCSYKKMFWKYAANLQENTHAEVWFQ